MLVDPLGVRVAGEGAHLGKFHRLYIPVLIVENVIFFQAQAGMGMSFGSIKM